MMNDRPTINNRHIVSHLCKVCLTGRVAETRRQHSNEKWLEACPLQTLPTLNPSTDLNHCFKMFMDPDFYVKPLQLVNSKLFLVCLVLWPKNYRLRVRLVD